MRNRHGGIFVEQQLQQRTPDQIGAADHDRVHALERGMHAPGQDDAAERRARRQRRKSAGKPAGIVRMQPVDILGGIDGVDDGFGMKRFRQRQLHQNAVHQRIAVEPRDQRQQIGLRDVGRQHMLERRHAGFLRLLVLAADIDLACGIVADQYHRKTRRQPALALHARNLSGDAGAKLGGNALSIDDPGRHFVTYSLIIPTSPRSVLATSRRAWPDRRRRRLA